MVEHESDQAKPGESFWDRLMAAFVAFERRDHAERTKAGIKAAKERREQQQDEGEA